MFDIQSKRGKAQYQGEMLRLMTRLEATFARGLRPLINRQFRLAAESVASGVGDTDRAVDRVSFPLASYFVQRYRQTATVFGEEALKRFVESQRQKQDTMRTRFWQTMNVWARQNAAKQVVKVNRTTKKNIATILFKGMGEGKSNAEMAKDIRKIGQIASGVRAKRIARTETHTASVHSIDEATKSTGMDFDREWVAAIDDRTRRPGKHSVWNHIGANGERVGMEEPFQKTGEQLMYPGDPSGSAGNVINCRCVLIYHSEKKIAIEPEPEGIDEVIYPIPTEEEVKKVLDKVKRRPKVDLFGEPDPEGVFRKGFFRMHKFDHDTEILSIAKDIKGKKKKLGIEKIIEVDKDKLIAKQGGVTVKKMEYPLRNPNKGGFPVVVRYKNKDMIWDGHHRLTADLLLKHDRRKVLYIDYDRIRKLRKLAKTKLMDAVGDFTNCIISKSIKSAYIFVKKPKACRDYVRVEGKWYLQGQRVTGLALQKLEDMKLPPAWREVVVSADMKSKVQAIGLDKVGRWQYRYSEAHVQAAAKKKFDRVKSFSRDMGSIRTNIKEGMRRGDPRAFLLELENRTAIRIGSEKDFRARKKAYGLTTLRSRHVTVKGDRILLKFTAKEGKAASYELRDRRLASWLKKRKSGVVSDDDMLFPDVPARRLNSYLKQVADGKSYSVKDFRTYHGTRIAFEELKTKAGVKMSAKEKNALVKKVSAKVSDFLANTPAMAKKAYIDPMVWDFIGGI